MSGEISEVMVEAAALNPYNFNGSIKRDKSIAG